MIFKKAILMPVFAAMVAGGFAVEKLNTLPRVVVPAVPLKFLSGGLVQVSPVSTVFSLGTTVWGSGGAIAGGTMTFMGRRMVDRGDGGYSLNINDIEPRAGMPVVMTFKGPGAGSPLYSGTVPLPPLIVFINPVNEARIDVSGEGSLTFSWSGGNPPYRLWIYPIEVSPRTFNMTDIAATSVSVPFSKFASGKRYRVYLRDAYRKFVFDRPVDPATNLSFNQLAEILIYTL